MWQHPYVNICKRARIGQSWKEIKKSGEATFVMNNSVRAWTIQIRGKVPSTNYIKFPKSDSKSLDLSGQYIYLELSANKSKNFKFYIDVNTTNKFKLSFSLSNMHRKAAVRGHTSLVPFNFSNRKWMVVAIDIPSLISKYGPPGFDESHYLSIRSVQVCAEMNVRNLFTSDNMYDPETIPKELAFPVRPSQSWEELYGWKWLPATPTDDERPSYSSPSRSPPSARRSPGKQVLRASNRAWTAEKRHFKTKSALAVQDNTADSATNALNRAAQLLAREGKLRSTPSRFVKKSSKRSSERRKKNQNSPFDSALKRRTNREVSEASEILNRAGLPSDPDMIPPSAFDEMQLSSPGTQSYINAQEKYEKTTSDIGLKTSSAVDGSDMAETLYDETSLYEEAKKPEIVPTLRPDPIMALDSVVGFTGDFPNSMVWSPDGKFMIFPCSSSIAIMKVDEDLETNGKLRQTVLHGHNARISCITLNNAGTLLASAQAGKFPTIRLWRIVPSQDPSLPPNATCIAILTAHSSDITSLAFSGDDHLLCASGKDSHHRRQLVVWDVTHATMDGSDNWAGLKKDQAYPIVARQISEFDVRKLKFSPYEPRRLLSCGRENIRFWRIKRGLLRGMPVILNEYARDTQFTDLAFESSYAPKPFQGSVQKRVFVSTKAGTVVQVNYETQDLECVYRLHDTAINSIAINEGFCVTGGADNYLRVWPLDFSDYFLEAEHEGPVMSVAISSDGLKLAIGTSSGTLGTLDVASQKYKTLLRSHVGSIHSCAIDPNPGRNEFITVSSDGTIRVWSMENFEQLFEFDAPADNSKCLAYQPSSDPSVRRFACGFESGCIRIFDVPNTKMTHEYQQHDGPVEQILYDPVHGRRMYSAGKDGNLCVYDVMRDYQPVKMVASDTEPLHVSMSINRDGTMLASVAPDATFCIIFRADSLMPLRKIRRSQSKGYSADRLKTKSDEGSISEPTSGFQTIQFSPSGKELLVATTDGRLVRYNPYNGEMLSQTGVVHRGRINSMSYSPNGHYFITAGEDTSLKVWERSLRGGSLPNFQSFVGHSAKVNAVNFTWQCDSLKVLSVGDEEGILAWNFHGVQEYKKGASGEDHEDENAGRTRRAKSNSFRPPVEEALDRVIKKIKKLGHLVSMSIAKISHSITDLEPKDESKKTVDAFQKAITRLKFNLSEDDLELICLHFSSGHPGYVDTEKFLGILRKRAAGPFQSKLAFDKSRATGSKVVVGSKPSEFTNAKAPATLDGNNDKFAQPQFSFSESGISFAEDTEVDSMAAQPQPPKEDFEVSLSTILGYQGNGIAGNAKNNVIWNPETGLFGFSCGKSVVFEDLVPANDDDLSTRSQKIMFGPKNDIQIVAVSPSAKYIAAAELPGKKTRSSNIFVWGGDGKFCYKLGHSNGILQDLKFAAHDNFLISVGSFLNPVISVWDISKGNILTSYQCARTGPPVHSIMPVMSSCPVHFFSVGRRSISEWQLVIDENGDSALDCNSVFDLPMQTNGATNEYFTSIAIESEGDDEEQSWSIAVGGHSGTVWLFDGSVYETGNGSRFKFRLNGFWAALDGSIDHIEIHPSSDHVIAAGLSHKVKVWAVGRDVNPSLAGSCSLDGHVISMHWDDEKCDAIVGTDQGTVWCLRRNRRKLLAIPMTRSHSAPVKALATSESGILLASAGGDDGSIRVWQTQLMQDILVLPHDSEEGSCNAVSFSVNSKSGGARLLAAGYTDGTVRQYDLTNIYLPGKEKSSSSPTKVKSGKVENAFAEILISKCRQPHRHAVTALEYVSAFQRFGTPAEKGGVKNVLISGSSNGDVVLNLQHGKIIRDLTTPHRGSRITCIERSTFDPAVFLVASNNTAISVWRCEISSAESNDANFQQLASLALGSKKKKRKAANEPHRPTLACFSPVDTSVLLCTTDQKPSLIAFYCFSTKRFLRTIPMPHWRFATSLSSYVCLASSKSYIAAGLDNGEVFFLNYHTEQVADMIVDSNAQNTKINSLTFCSAQNTLVSTSGANLYCWRF